MDTRPHLVLPSLLVAAATGLASAPALGQTPTPWAPAALTADDYARAERFLGRALDTLVVGGAVDPSWLPDGRFWYVAEVEGGHRFVLVDPSSPERAPAFDHARMARALGEAADTSFTALTLPDGGAALSGDGRTATFRVRRATWACDVATYRCRPDDPAAAGPDTPSVLSPDGRSAAFIRDHDLWVRDMETGRESRLTTDGVEDFGYATDNAGWTRSDRPVLRWSPDSRKIATFQHDARGVGMMYLTRTRVGHPELEAWRYPMPEDSVIFRISRVVIDLDRPAGERVVRFRMPPDPHRSTTCDHVFCGGTFTDVAWAPDASRLAFVSSSRDHKRATLRVADASTGEVRTVLEETVPTFFESGARAPNWRYLPASGEVIWFSERDDWGHLYLYDLATGELKHRITGGAWNVLEVLDVDEEGRTITFLGNGREPGDPYFEYLYRIGFDGKGLTLLTPDSAHHEVELAPDGRTFVDTWSTPVTPPRTALRDRNGRVVLPLEEADASGLAGVGWQPPLPFTVKARDGETDLYGLLYRPTGFDPARTYPVIDYIYPGPQTGSVGSRSFSASRRGHQALAELGFVVVALDAMGTPLRSKSFHEAYYGDMGDNGLPDQVAGLRQLARRYPWIDPDRVGIWGHSGGGFASTAAMFRYPDFFKVAVSEAGNHDNRNYEDDWGEKWQGLLETRPDGTTTYDNQANQLVAGNLRGKLLLAHGTMDNNVPPSNTMLVVDALIAANKDFDLLLLPNRRHGFANEAYMVRRRWDYFVRNLLGAEPPEDYEIGAGRPTG